MNGHPRSFFKDEERKERFKNGALSNYVSSFLLSYHDKGACGVKEIEVKRG